MYKKTRKEEGRTQKDVGRKEGKKAGRKEGRKEGCGTTESYRRKGRKDTEERKKGDGRKKART